MNVVQSIRVSALCAFGLPVLAACGNGLLASDAQPVELYRLSAPVPAAAQPATPSGPALSVARPRAAAPLDTDRIALVAPGHAFDYYAGVRWAEPAPQMLQQQLVTALAAEGRYAAVFASPARVPSELMLDVEVRRFEADTSAGGAPVVHVELQGSLVDTRRAERLASFTSAAQATATQPKRGAVIDAFDRAAAEAVKDAVQKVNAAAATLPAR